MRSLVLVAALIGGCRCADRETVAGELEGPLRARVVKTERTRPGLGAGAHFVIVPTVETTTTHQLEIDTDPTTTLGFESSCETAFTLESDAEGRRIAVRCAAGGPWRVAYLGARGGRGYFGVDEVAAEAVDWATIPTLREAAARIFTEAVRDPEAAGPLRRALLEDVETGGGEALADVLVATLDAAPIEAMGRYQGCPHRDQPEDAWEVAWRRLEGAAQARVDAALRERLAREGVTLVQLLRAARHLPPDATLARASIAALSRIDGEVEEPARGVVLRRAARHAPTEAGQLACRSFAKGGDRAPYRREDALAVLVATGTRCPEAAAWLADLERLCAEGGLCGAPDEPRACTEAEEEKAIAAVLAADRRCRRRGAGGVIFAARRALGVASSADPVPAMKRLAYRVEPSAPDCLGDGDVVGPCHYPEAPTAACQAGARTSFEVRPVLVTLSVEVDDAARVIRATRAEPTAR